VPLLDDDQGIEPPEQHGVHMDEVGRENALGLGGQELLPGRARAARRGIDPGGMQDLPDRRGSDRVAEPDEFAVHPPVPQAGLSIAMRITSLRIVAGVGGRPGLRRLV
jgi:hypothetical protein